MQRQNRRQDNVRQNKYKDKVTKEQKKGNTKTK